MDESGSRHASSSASSPDTSRRRGFEDDKERDTYSPGIEEAPATTKGRRRHATRDFLLNSPQYESTRLHDGRAIGFHSMDVDDEADPDRTLVTPSSMHVGQKTMEERAATEAVEREQLERELEEIEQSIERLRRIHGDAAAGKGSESMNVETEDDGEDLETLESMLREMDDQALSALLTSSGKSPALETLLQFLPKGEKNTVQAPARSAGIEGTGSAFQLDEEQKRLRTAADADLDDHVEESLQKRLDRSVELGAALAQFTGVTLENVESHKPVLSRTGKDRALRHIQLRGMLEGDLGAIVLDMDVEEILGKKSSDLPQIVTLDVEVDDAVYYGLGDERIKSFVRDVNLPALLLAVRTMIPIAKVRYQFMTSIAVQFSELAEVTLHKWERRRIALGAAEGSKDYPSLSNLVDPAFMQTLSLRRPNGVALDVEFQIDFDQWGHARPFLTIKPTIPEEVVKRNKREIQHLAREMPRKFHHFCAYRPFDIDLQTALVSIIDSFFLSSTTT